MCAQSSCYTFEKGERDSSVQEKAITTYACLHRPSLLHRWLGLNSRSKSIASSERGQHTRPGNWPKLVATCIGRHGRMVHGWHLQGCTTLFHQMYTIHAFKHSQPFPVVYCLPPRKSQEVYAKLFSIFAEAMDNLLAQPRIVRATCTAEVHVHISGIFTWPL